MSYLKKVQEDLTPDLQSIIFNKIIQHHKKKEIFRELYFYLAMEWNWSILIIPNINIKAIQTMIRALYKGLVRKVTIDCSYPMNIFVDVIFTILKQARKDRRKLDI